MEQKKHEKTKLDIHPANDFYDMCTRIRNRF